MNKQTPWNYDYQLKASYAVMALSKWMSPSPCSLALNTYGGTRHWDLYLFARAALTECEELGGLHKRNWLSHSSGGEKSESRVLAGSIPSECWEGQSVSCLSPNFQWFISNLWLPWLVGATLWSLLSWVLGLLTVCASVSVPEFSLLVIILDWTHLNDLILIWWSAKILSPDKLIHRYWGLGISTFRGDTIQAIRRPLQQLLRKRPQAQMPPLQGCY